MNYRLAIVLLSLSGLGAPAFAAETPPAEVKAEPKAESKVDAREAAAKAELAREIERKEGEADAARIKRASLESKIAPVSGHLFRKRSRLEVTPGLGVSLGDAFFQKYVPSLKMDYHLNESFAVGLYASYSLNTPSSVVGVCNGGTCSEPQMEDLTRVPGKLGMQAGLQVGWTPLYGKVNLAAEKVLHFDLGVSGGLGAVQYQVPDPAGTDTFAFGGHLGIGQRYFLGRSLTLRVELRDYLYNAKIVQLGSTNTKLENQLMLELGLSFFAGEPSRG